MVGAEFDVVTYSAIELGQEDAKAAYQIVSGACACAPREMILGGVTKARVKCKKHKEDMKNEQAVLNAYVELFFPWPADVTMKVLGKMHMLEDGWWPSAASVEKELRFYGGARKSLMSALYDAGCRPPKDETPPETKHYTRQRVSHAERFKRIAAEITRREYDLKSMDQFERAKIIDQVSADLDAQDAETL